MNQRKPIITKREYLLFLLFLTIPFSFAFAQETEYAEYSGKQPLKKDSFLVSINFDGKTVQIKADKENANRINHINALANIAIKRHKDLDSTNVSFVDFTGNGKPEKVVAHIINVKGKIEVFHFIYQNSKLIYSDTLDTHDFDREVDNFEYYDSINTNYLEPYGSFYDGLEMISIDKGLLPKDLISNDFCSGFRRGVLEGRNMPEKEIERQLVIFEKYLKDFKGHVISTHTPDAGIWIWYEPEHQFIDLYEP